MPLYFFLFVLVAEVTDSRGSLFSLRGDWVSEETGAGMPGHLVFFVLSSDLRGILLFVCVFRRLTG